MNYSNLKQHECKGRYFLPCITANINADTQRQLVLSHVTDVDKLTDELSKLYYDFIPFNTTFDVRIKLQLDKQRFEIVEVTFTHLSAAMRFVNNELTKWIDYHVNK